MCPRNQCGGHVLGGRALGSARGSYVGEDKGCFDMSTLSLHCKVVGQNEVKEKWRLAAGRNWSILGIYMK